MFKIADVIPVIVLVSSRFSEIDHVLRLLGVRHHVVIEKTSTKARYIYIALVYLIIKDILFQAV